jgi:Uncharacterized protein conserved in bacteria (DUF2188)
MGKKAIRVEAKGESDWLVREDGGGELGHYATRAEAHAVGHKLARKHSVELVMRDESGKVQRSLPRKGWFARLFER